MIQIDLYHILKEASTASVKLDLGKYSDQLFELLKDLQDWSRSKYPEDYLSDDQIKQYHEQIIQATQQALNERLKEVQEAVQRIPDFGSSVLVSPHWWPEDRENQFDPVESAQVTVKRPGEGTGEPAYFTFFAPFEGFPQNQRVDDVLEGEDPDFFKDSPGLQFDYFQLVQELRCPGSSARPGKTLTLYTARPKSDRPRYEGAKTVPSGIFLTSDFDRAEGIAQDLDGKEGRDLYQIRINERYLIQTLDAGHVRDYQVVGSGDVPIQSISLL